MQGIGNVALTPEASTQLLDMVGGEPGLLRQDEPVRPDPARVRIGLDAEPGEHREFVDADAAELDMLVDAAAQSKVVVGTGRTRAAGAH
jgi:hypothetical protein